jgi:putative ABC transport system ATP-binding protein
MTPLVVEIRDLRFRYVPQGFGLHVPRLEIAARESVAIVGPSGSGKTTLLHLLGGILVPASGQLRVAGADLIGLSDARRRAFRVGSIGFVFQDFGLIDSLNVVDNIVLPYRVSPVPAWTADVVPRAEELARRLGLGDQLRRRVSGLSHGEKQRVAVARAVLTRPPLILADEPTGNLDPAVKGQVLDALFDASHEAQSTLVVVTHDHTILGRFDRTIDFADFLEVPENAGATA